MQTDDRLETPLSCISEGKSGRIDHTGEGVQKYNNGCCLLLVIYGCSEAYGSSHVYILLTTLPTGNLRVQYSVRTNSCSNPFLQLQLREALLLYYQMLLNHQLTHTHTKS